MLLAQVARRGRHDRTLGHYQSPARQNRAADIFFTDEIQRRLVGRNRVPLKRLGIDRHLSRQSLGIAWQLSGHWLETAR